MNSGLQPEIIRGKFSVSRYGADFVEVNNILINTSCIISTDNEPVPWEIMNVSQITKAEVENLFKNNPDVVLIGTGSKHIMLDEGVLAYKSRNESSHLDFLDSNSAQPVSAADCMSTHAACRTFNFLAAEGRSVVAGLILEVSMKDKLYEQ